MKIIMLLSLLFVLACVHEPKKEYKWISLSDRGFTENSLKVLKENKDFQSDKGFEDLQIMKHPLNTQSTENIKKNIKKIVIIGDTGCRLKELKTQDVYQNCKDPKEWVYPSVIEKIAAETPDLIIHLGDYHYREQCSEGKICRQYTDTIGYGWRSWNADFFSPSQKGFQAAPWIFVRGNHEDCKRAFEGYQILSEQKWDKNCIPAEKTQYIQMGNLLIVQLDSASVNDALETPENETYWEQQFKEIEQTITSSSAQQVWLVSHKPIIGLVEDNKGGISALNINLRKAFAKTSLNKKIGLMIAGHIHNTQFLRAETFPQQIIVGNSGTPLNDYKYLEHQDEIIKNKIDGLKITDFFSDTKSKHNFGYAVMTKSTDEINWDLELKDIEGQTTFSSSSSSIKRSSSRRN